MRTAAAASRRLLRSSGSLRCLQQPVGGCRTQPGSSGRVQVRSRASPQHQQRASQQRAACAMVGGDAPGGEPSGGPSAAQATADGARLAGVADGASADGGAFRIVAEERMFKRYLTLYNRRVAFPATPARAATEIEYDLIGHPQCDFHFATTFPFHRAADGRPGPEVTLLREYCQGLNAMMFSLPAGGFDPARHASRQACAAAELSEEAHLTGGAWHCLLPEGSAGFCETKWCMNRFTPFLCIDPQPDASPGQRDAEELIEVHRVGIPELRRLMVSGEMLLHSMTTCYLALDRLREQGQL